MAQAILASDEVIEENPELIRKLVQATLKGLRDIIADPKAAAADYVKAVPEHQGKEATIENIFRLYVQYVYKDQPVPGAMDEERLSKVQDFYLKQGIIRKASALDELYTNEFVK
jgi:NitT/TauT family transport system substrate-binding protein